MKTVETMVQRIDKAHATAVDTGQRFFTNTEEKTKIVVNSERNIYRWARELSRVAEIWT